jgi:hypothetical protein
MFRLRVEAFHLDEIWIHLFSCSLAVIFIESSFGNKPQMNLFPDVLKRKRYRHQVIRVAELFRTLNPSISILMIVSELKQCHDVAL